MIEKIIEGGEGKNIEFKEKLLSSVHLKEERKRHLASQMKFRLENGNGKAIYIIGVTDDGKVKGLNRLEFEETLTVLRAVASENLASIKEIEKFVINGKIVARVTIERIAKEKINVVVATAGHVDSGKSTLLGTLISGIADDGAG
ncbi:MAG: GTP-binding protein, partial [Candidatus Aenigmarchaeota archaeon]|nr:GTP-binding protein [Candidatus Aenigmarchaeota archaeon]